MSSPKIFDTISDLAGKLTQSRLEFHHRPKNGTAMAPHSSFATFGPNKDVRTTLNITILPAGIGFALHFVNRGVA